MKRTIAVAMMIGVQGAASAAHADEVARWGELTEEAIAAHGVDPASSTRAFTLVYVALHDAANAVRRRFEPIAFDGRDPRACVEAAMAQAGHDALCGAIPAARPAADAALVTALAAVPAGCDREAGTALGARAAQAILAERAGDDVAAALTYLFTDGTAAGEYRATPPIGVVLGAGLHLLIPPFVLPEVDLFRPRGPRALTSVVYTRDYHEVRSLGRADSRTRTADQTAMADFYFEAVDAQWDRMLRGHHGRLDPWEAARLHALVMLALFDAQLATFDAKYTYRFWRPVTAIPLGDRDGNVFTRAEPDWRPYCVTPPVAEYPSNHTAGAFAVAVVVEELLGRIDFTMDSRTLAGATRRFERPLQAAWETGLSRIYCGIHYRDSVEIGARLGRDVARYVLGHAAGPARRRF